MQHTHTISLTVFGMLCLLIDHFQCGRLVTYVSDGYVLMQKIFLLRMAGIMESRQMVFLKNNRRGPTDEKVSQSVPFC